MIFKLMLPESFYFFTPRIVSSSCLHDNVYHANNNWNVRFRYYRLRKTFWHLFDEMGKKWLIDSFLFHLPDKFSYIPRKLRLNLGLDFFRNLSTFFLVIKIFTQKVLSVSQAHIMTVPGLCFPPCFLSGFKLIFL